MHFVDPANGPFADGTELTIRGNDVDENVTVFVGGRMVEPLDQVLTGITPVGVSGTADVLITSA